MQGPVSSELLFLIPFRHHSCASLCTRLSSMDSSLECGCVAVCCGICSLAAAAARPRLHAGTAALWVPPDLSTMRGKKHQAKREAENGEAVLWFWQATGEHWGHATDTRPAFDSVAFNTASKASRRCRASQGERSEQTLKRRERRASAPTTAPSASSACSATMGSCGTSSAIGAPRTRQ